MVGFETRPEQYKQMLATKDPRVKRRKIMKWAVGGAAGVGIVAGVAAALAFGDIAMTLANSSVGDVMGAAGGDLLSSFADMADCCGACGDCADVCASCAVC